LAKLITASVVFAILTLPVVGGCYVCRWAADFRLMTENVKPSLVLTMGPDFRSCTPFNLNRHSRIWICTCFAMQYQRRLGLEIKFSLEFIKSTRKWFHCSLGINSYRQFAIVLVRWHLMADLILEQEKEISSTFKPLMIIRFTNERYGIEGKYLGIPHPSGFDRECHVN
jgi:hypothetical protein